MPGKPVTNKHFKKKPWLENYLALWYYLTSDLFTFFGGHIIPFKYSVNLQKGGMPFFLILQMIYFDNWSLGSWMYMALHGQYGLMWMFKHFSHPDPSFEEKQTIFSVLLNWSTVLGPYLIAGVCVNSRYSEAAQNPSPERCCLASMMFSFGLVLMMSTDV